MARSKSKKKSSANSHGNTAVQEETPSAPKATKTEAQTKAQNEPSSAPTTGETNNETADEAAGKANGESAAQDPHRPLSPLEQLALPEAYWDHPSTTTILIAWDSYTQGNQPQTRAVLAPLLAQQDLPEPVQKAARLLDSSTRPDTIPIAVGIACIVFFVSILWAVY